MSPDRKTRAWRTATCSVCSSARSSVGEQMEVVQGATHSAEASNDSQPYAPSSARSNDSAAPSSANPNGRAVAMEAPAERETPSSPSVPPHQQASSPPRDIYLPSRTPSSSPSVQSSRGATPSPVAAAQARRGPTRESNSQPPATGSRSVRPEPPARHRAVRSPRARAAIKPPEAPRTRTRVRAPSGYLPAAFPPSSRGVGGDGDGDGDGDSDGSSTSSPSPEANRSRVAGVIGARELDVGTSGLHELELSVPSHQEHLTADGQR